MSSSDAGGRLSGRRAGDLYSNYTDGDFDWADGRTPAYLMTETDPVASAAGYLLAETDPVATAAGHLTEETDPVATAAGYLTVDEFLCAEMMCGDFGVCDSGACICTDGYSGEYCDVAPPAEVACDAISWSSQECSDLALEPTITTRTCTALVAETVH